MAAGNGMLDLKVVPPRPSRIAPGLTCMRIRSLRPFAAVVGPHDKGRKSGCWNIRGAMKSVG